MIEEIFTGYWNALGQHRKAWQFILKHGLLWYFIFPFVLNLLVFLSGLSLVNQLSETTLTTINNWLSSLDFGMDEQTWVYTAIYVSIWIVIRVFYFLLFAYVGGYVVLLALSPVLAILTEQIQTKLTNRKYQFRLFPFINELFRGIIISIRNFALELLLVVIFFIAGLIPIIGVISPFALFFVTAFYYGFAIMDYNMEHQKMGVTQSIRFMRKNRGSVMGVGTPFAVVLIIPFLGPFVAGFLAINATVAGAMEVNRIMDQNNPEKY